MANKLILKFACGDQNTTTLTDFDSISKYREYLWLTKLSVLSFQRWFQEAEYVVMYNGKQFDFFCEQFCLSKPELIKNVKFLDQSKLPNPYPSFFPSGVWWKWVPFRIDVNANEIAIDTDIICISEPKSWKEWLAGNTDIVVAPERFEKIKINTCGDFHSHKLLKGKIPVNCGIVGQKAGVNYEERFFEITNNVNFGYTHNSMFITEQGAINLWVYSLESEGIKHSVLDFYKNAWMRDFVFFIRQGLKVETVHAVSWHKEIAKHSKDIWVKKVLHNDYSDDNFILDLISTSSDLPLQQHRVIMNQLGDKCSDVEFF